MLTNFFLPIRNCRVHQPERRPAFVLGADALDGRSIAIRDRAIRADEDNYDDFPRRFCSGSAAVPSSAIAEFWAKQSAAKNARENAASMAATKRKAGKL